MTKTSLLSFVIAGIGVLDSAYLSIVKLAHTEVYCGGSTNCQTVNTSVYAEIAGIPIAFLGVGAYLVILGLLYLEDQGQFWQENSRLMIFGITLAGFIYSIYLTYIEIAVIHAICPYCVVSAIAMALLFFISILRLFESQTETQTATRGG